MGKRPRRLQLDATSLSCPQSPQRRRRKAWARTLQSGGVGPPARSSSTRTASKPAVLVSGLLPPPLAETVHLERSGPVRNFFESIGIPDRAQRRPAWRLARLDRDDQARSCLSEPRRAADVFGALFARQITSEPNLLGLATGESVAQINYLLRRGEVIPTKPAQGSRARPRAG